MKVVDTHRLDHEFMGVHYCNYFFEAAPGKSCSASVFCLTSKAQCLQANPQLQFLVKNPDYVLTLDAASKRRPCCTKPSIADWITSGGIRLSMYANNFGPFSMSQSMHGRIPEGKA